jgi:hypothetical protein
MAGDFFSGVSTSSSSVANADVVNMEINIMDIIKFFIISAYLLLVSAQQFMVTPIFLTCQALNRQT